MLPLGSLSAVFLGGEDPKLPEEPSTEAQQQAEGQYVLALVLDGLYYLSQTHKPITKQEKNIHVFQSNKEAACLLGSFETAEKQCGEATLSE